MPDVNACPETTLLRQFLHGRLDEPDAGAMERHLEECPACVAALAPELDAVRAELPREPAEPLPDAAAMVERVRLILTGPIAAPSTPVHSPASTDTPSPSAAHAEFPCPAVIGRFQVLGLLGHGGMGVVYEAHDPQLDRSVAVKVPFFHGPPHRQAEARQRFLREARAAARVRHAHVCAIHDVGEHDGQPFVVLDLLGTSLERRLQEVGRFDDARAAVRLVLQVADALQVVHAQGILHRDLKPGNVLLDEAGRAYLTDFGLARFEDDAGLTDANAILGTPAYMAPEQASPEFGPVTARSDLYSLGMVLYRMLAGELPFKGPTLEVLRQVVHDPLPPPSRFRPGFDPALEAVILKALARRPSGRYATVADFAAALKEWLTQADRSTVDAARESPSPPYSGERGGGEGAGESTPLTPNPSPPEYRGRGEHPGRTLSPGGASVPSPSGSKRSQLGRLGIALLALAAILIAVFFSAKERSPTSVEKVRPLSGTLDVRI